MNLLKTIWKYWRAFGRKIETIVSYIFYSLFYLIVMSIPCIIARIASDPLHIKPVSSAKTNFSPWQGKKESLSDARMQF